MHQHVADLAAVVVVVAAAVVLVVVVSGDGGQRQALSRGKWRRDPHLSRLVAVELLGPREVGLDRLERGRDRRKRHDSG